MIRSILAVALFACIPFLSFADTIHVPGDQPTVLAAIAAANSGDTILVAPGTYTGAHAVQSKQLAIVSSHGPEVTTLRNPLDYQPVIEFRYTPSGTLIEGFTITEAASAGVSCSDGYCTIRGNIIINNTAGIIGSGVRCNKMMNCVISDNIICKNVGNRCGGGIYLYDSTALIANNFIYDNLAYGVYIGDPPFPVETFGGGIYNYSSTVDITNCIVFENEVSDGYMVYGHSSGIHNSLGTVNVSNTIVWGNTGAEQLAGDFNLNYCALEENYSGGVGNIFDDPKLTVVSDTEFFIDATSPCIDTGDNSAPGIQDFDAMGMPRTLDGNGDNTSITDISVNEFLMLSADTYTLPEPTGGTINFALDAGPDDAFRNYLILGCVSGTSPGTPLPGGYVTLPLNWDAVTDQIWALTNSPALIDFIGTLDAKGQATAQLNIGPLPGTAGANFYFAFTCNNPFDIASHSLEFEVVP